MTNPALSNSKVQLCWQTIHTVKVLDANQIVISTTIPANIESLILNIGSNLCNSMYRDSNNTISGYHSSVISGVSY